LLLLLLLMLVSISHRQEVTSKRIHSHPDTHTYTHPLTHIHTELWQGIKLGWQHAAKMLLATTTTATTTTIAMTANESQQKAQWQYVKNNNKYRECKRKTERERK